MQFDVAALLYSSGTTGKSKGVILTHRNFISASLAGTSDQDRYGEVNNVFLCFLPMYHVFGLSIITYSQLRRGNTYGGVDEEVRSGEGSEGSGGVQSDVPVCCSAGYD